jgi:hypothetical protein
LADARAVAEASVQNAIADALAVLEASRTADPTALERLYVATTLGEVEQLRATLGLGDRPVPRRGRAPSGELWPAIHALESELQAERDVYAGRYVEAETVIRVGLVDRVSAIATRLRREFAFPSRLYVFAAEFTLAELKATERRIQVEHFDLIDQGIPLLEYGLAVLRNRVAIEVEHDVERHGAFLRDRFGPTVVVERGEPAVLA